jgi:hypothetical protein
MIEIIGIAYLIIGGIVAGAERWYLRREGVLDNETPGEFAGLTMLLWLLWPLIVGAWLARYWRRS